MKFDMKNVLYFALTSVLLYSCTEANRTENGRYLPAAVDKGVIYILDSQTGRLYFGNPHDLEDLVKLQVEGAERIEYIDFVEGAQKREN